jgi:soluble lytic murein transglycosylase
LLKDPFLSIIELYFVPGCVKLKCRATERSTPSRKKPLHAVLAALFLVVFACHASASPPEAAKNLRDGKKDLLSGHLQESVQELETAQKDFPLLGDYALFYLASAYQKLEEPQKALASARALLKQYPDSPLLKKARAIEATGAGQVPGEDVLGIFAAYVKDYPGDEQAAMTYASLLEKAGETEKAEAVYRKVYVMAGTFSDRALAQLKTKDITAEDLNERASNLIANYRYGEAERDLRKALSMDCGKEREDILRNLGHALFRQKKYDEAASVYKKIDDTYARARSLYRAGDKDKFTSVLDDLAAKKDRRAGGLMLALAADKRRDGDVDGAMKLYNSVLDSYPADREDALWGLGWTYYTSGDYRKASEIFSKLHAGYDDPKYVYWKARSLEAEGEDPKSLYASLSKAEDGYYSAVAAARTGGGLASTVSSSGTEGVGPPADSGRPFDRVEALLALGMKDEAIMELGCLSRKVDSLAGANYIVARLLQLGQYRRAIGIATRGRYSEQLRRFWYPLAYWDDVKTIAGQQEIDPFMLLAVMREESRFDASAQSVAGARGLMQIMPATAYRLDKTLKLGIHRPSQIHDADNNITLGAFYLKSLFAEFGSFARVLAAYNAGEVITRKWEQQGNYKSDDEFIEDIPYPETRNYVKKVITSYFEYRKSAAAETSGPGLAVILGNL